MRTIERAYRDEAVLTYVGWVLVDLETRRAVAYTPSKDEAIQVFVTHRDRQDRPPMAALPVRTAFPQGMLKIPDVVPQVNVVRWAEILQAATHGTWPSYQDDCLDLDITAEAVAGVLREELA